MSSIVFDGVNKVYKDGTHAVIDLNLKIDEGEFMVLVGPSGCGKTTALRMLAGLEEISSGELRVDGKLLNHVEPRKRDMAMVFQNYALYPHMTVFENIAFPLRSASMPKDLVTQRVERAAGRLDLTAHLKRRPGQLSGGQRQRVAMGRAIVREPKAFLMDEPLSNLDAKLRVQMRAEISSLQRSLGVTTIYVTHDQVEAMTMGHRIAVMRKGVLQQCATSQELYDAPVNLFVATFIGSPPMNLFRARVGAGDGGLELTTAAGSIALSQTPASFQAALDSYVGGEVAVGVRPERLISNPRPEGLSRLKAKITLVESLGAERLLHLEVAASPVVTEALLEIASDTDEAVVETLETSGELGRTMVVIREDTRTQRTASEHIEFGVDATDLHIFDIETGLAIR